jgi:Tfp pilus assembly protein PilF
MAATGHVMRAELSLEETIQLALDLHNQERNDQALQVIWAVLAKVRDDSNAWNVLGIIKCHQSEYLTALDAFEKAMAISPTPMIRSNRAMVLSQLGRNEEALSEWQVCVKEQPNNPIFWNNIGNVLERLERYEEALPALDRTLKLDPEHTLTYFNRGIVLARLARDDEAIANFNMAVARDPHYADAFYNRGLCKLRTGDLLGGFVDYEWRLRSPETSKGLPKFEDRPMWNGRASLKGKSILLHGEQGMGDMIMMMRYVSIIAGMGAAVYMVVHKPLKPLIDIAGVHLLEEGKDYPSTDYWLPIMSLPMVFKTSVTTIPAPWRPEPDPKLFEEWRTRLNGLGLYHNGRPKVALCWSGNPKHKQDRNRSIPFDAFFRSLVKIKADFVSFQVDMRPDDRAAFEAVKALHPRLHDISEHLTNFHETAHALAFMDVVITVDTALAHLAGTLRKETWVLIGKTGSDWRWLRERIDTLWYPRMTLYRQEQTPTGEWPDLLSRTAGDLKSFAGRYF